MSRPPPLRCKRHLVVRATAAAALAVILLSPSIKKTLRAGKLDRMDSVRTGNRRRLPFVNTWLTLRGGRRPSMYPSLIMDDEIETGDEGMEKAQMELLERSMPYPASIREQSSWAKRDKNLKYKAFTDALLFDGRTDLLPKPLPYNDKAFNEDSDPYEDEYDPPAPGLWRNAGKNKTYWGMTTRQFKDLEDYVQDIRDPKCQPDWLPLEGYHEAKRKLITAIQHQDQRELKEAIEFGIRFGGLMGYIMQAEVLIAQLRERERYERYKVRKGFLKEKTMTIHINDRRSLILAKEKRCKELTIVSPEPQYQIVNISGGEPDYGAWLELDGCERKADGRYQVLLANDTVNRQMNMASMRLVDVRPEYIRKKQDSAPMAMGGGVGAVGEFNKTAEQVARSRETDFLVSAESEEAPMKEPEPLMDGKGHVISGMPCGVETSLRVCLGRLFGVPPIPLAKPSVTERMINVSHTKMAPDPITR
eukprot:jgi/Bigna1/82856/fgenesh1_pg.98_\